MARPSEYSEDIVAKAWAYARGGWLEVGDKVPSVAGLACEIGIHRDTCYAWADDDDKEFSDILKEIAQIQERTLVNSGLSGVFNPPITKMMLSKHGYSDAVDTRHTSPDGSMTPKPGAVINATMTAKEAADAYSDTLNDSEG